MLHAGIRGLNSLADLEILQSFSEKYFGNTVENRNPTLLEVLHFEEEILRQKVTWKEKYESVISNWITPKSAKSNLKAYRIDEGQSKAGEGGSQNNEMNAGEEKKSINGVETDEKKQEDIIHPNATTASDKPAVVEMTKTQTPSADAGVKTTVTDKNASPVVPTTARESTSAAPEQTKPDAEENKRVSEDNKPVAEEMNKPTAAKEVKIGKASTTEKPANITAQ